MLRAARGNGWAGGREGTEEEAGRCINRGRGRVESGRGLGTPAQLIGYARHGRPRQGVLLPARPDQRPKAGAILREEDFWALAVAHQL